MIRFSFAGKHLPPKGKPLFPRKKADGEQHYMIDLHRGRSRMALLACVIALFAALYAIGVGLVYYAGKGEPATMLFRYFTIDSNILTAFGASVAIPFAVEGIRNKRFTYPKWAALLHYSGTICVTLTMVFAVCIISWYDPVMAFGGANFLLHLVCPIMVLVSFFLVESDHRYTLRDSVLCLIPFFVYAVVYFLLVVVIGADRGGWEDIYHLADNVPIFFTFPAMVLLAFGISSAIRWFYNRKAARRAAALEARWKDDVDPVEIKVEIFGLGRYMGKTGDENYAIIPLDILAMLADRYGMKTEELISAYAKGLVDALEEQKEPEPGPPDDEKAPEES